MDQEGGRSLRWRRFLGIISSDPGTWIQDTQVRRQYYTEIVTMYSEYQLENATANEMEADLRTLSTLSSHPMLRSVKFTSGVRNVLRHWALAHPSPSYKPGMHLLVAVTLYVLLSEHDESDSNSPRKPYKPPLPPKPSSFTSEGRPSQPDMLGRSSSSSSSSPSPGRRPSSPPPGRSSSYASEHQCANDPTYAEHDAFYMFSRLMEHLENMFIAPTEGTSIARDRPPPPPAPISRLADNVQHGLLAAVDPILLDHLRNLDIRPSEYIPAWVTTLFAAIIPLGSLVVIWDHLLSDLMQTPPNATRGIGLPLLPKACTALLLALQSELLRSSDKTGCIRVLTTMQRSIDAEPLIEQARCLQDPFYVASIAPNIDVVEFGEGPLGIVLVKSGADLQVSSCGAGGQAEQSGRIQVGDVVHSVNGVKLPDITPQQLVDHVSRVGKPLYIAFHRTAGRMSIQYDHAPIGINGLDKQRPPRPGPKPPVPQLPANNRFEQRSSSGADRRVVSQAMASPISNHRQQQRPPAVPAKDPRGGQVVLRAPDGFTPDVTAGEQALSMVPLSLETAEFQPDSGILMKVQVNGVLFVTSYRLIFHKFTRVSPPSNDIYWHIPIYMIWKAECAIKDAIFGFGTSEKSITVHCKDGQLRKFTAQPQMEDALLETYRTLTAIGNQGDVVFPYLHFTARQSYSMKAQSEYQYDLYREYERVGLTQYPGVRIWDQRQAIVCETYPRYIAIPQITLDELMRVAAYRSKQRIPIVVWRDPETRATISRCAQPLVGIKSNRCAEDEKYVGLLRDLGGKSKFFIIDARSRVATIGNKAIGKGTEMIKYYMNVEMLFMDIGNIHSVRESEANLHALYRPWALQSGGTYAGKLEQTGWLNHIYLILSAAIRVVDVVRSQGNSCLVHCSDGWDRTSQITSLSLILLDPYHRSMHGFFTVIEKEWLDYGHKFHDRCAHGTLSSDDERSPIFVLWLDCVWQLVRQFPNWFEFNENLLLFLADNVYSCRFGTFLYNSYKERKEHDVSRRTTSIWVHVEEHIDRYRNAAYRGVDSVLMPSCNPKNLRLWEAYFTRFDTSLIPAPVATTEYV